MRHRLVHAILMTGAAGCNGDDEAPGTSDTDAPSACDTRPIDVPTGRGELDGVWDADRQRFVLFGGNEAVPIECAPGATDFVGHTWVFETDCDNFAKLDPADGPGRRGRQAVARDAARGWMVLHGGRFRSGDSGPYTNYGDLWAFDMAADAWTRLAGPNGGPSARVNHGAAVVGDRFVVFGGNESTDGAFFSPLDDTWAYDLAASRWSKLDTTNDPPPRLYHAAATDGQRLYVYGGGNENAFLGDFFTDLWALDLGSLAWTELHDGGGDAPVGRIMSHLEVDADRNRLILFGGHDDGVLGNNNELWSFALDTNRWTQLSAGDTFSTPQNDICDFPADFTTIDPAAPDRRQAAATDVTDAGELILFGGKTDCGNANDVWTWSMADEAWTNLSRATEGEVCLRWSQSCSSMCF